MRLIVAQVLALNETHLLADHRNSDDQKERNRKLKNHEAFSCKQFAEASFQVGLHHLHWLKLGQVNRRIDSRQKARHQPNSQKNQDQIGLKVQSQSFGCYLIKNRLQNVGKGDCKN